MIGSDVVIETVAELTLELGLRADGMTEIVPSDISQSDVKSSSFYHDKSSFSVLGEGRIEKRRLYDLMGSAE